MSSVLLYGSSEAQEGSFERHIHDAFVPWIVRRVPHMLKAGVKSLGPCLVFVVASSTDPKARVRAAVAFHNWQRAFRLMEVSMASDSPLWAKPQHVETMIKYVFNTAGCERLQAVVPKRGAGPKHTQRFLRHIGFRFEGVGRKALYPDDALMFSMLRQDASRWLGENDGEREPVRATAA